MRTGGWQKAAGRRNHPIRQKPSLIAVHRNPVTTCRRRAPSDPSRQVIAHHPRMVRDPHKLPVHLRHSILQILRASSGVLPDFQHEVAALLLQSIWPLQNPN